MFCILKHFKQRRRGGCSLFSAQGCWLAKWWTFDACWILAVFSELCFAAGLLFRASEYVQSFTRFSISAQRARIHLQVSVRHDWGTSCWQTSPCRRDEQRLCRDVSANCLLDTQQIKAAILMTMKMLEPKRLSTRSSASSGHSPCSLGEKRGGRRGRNVRVCARTYNCAHL